ncbi:hypothetical protein [Brevibacterium aurantiacum]|uniref:Secreted protein n=1 Tax=Brevibacterium aurantiacum TaxID=273384 RepID=A0A2H1KUM8_BREAU|nr:hypothetical protein [Brevibacterium aurantiacum]TGD36308.1 hypothetical protein EB834_20235 [Brevibacterium aurantiacum]SMY03264.1 hypothetical protein BAURA63_03754 [Brevibacterium aurantiacum]
MSPISRTALSAAAAVLALTLTACSSGDDADKQSADDAQTQESTEESSEAAGSKGESGSAEAAGLDPNNLPDPVATQDIPATVKGDDEATMTVQLFPLKRKGETLVAQFAFTVNSEKAADEDDPGDNLYGYLGRNGSWSPFLVDSQNLRKHHVLKYSVDKAQTDSVGTNFKPGQTHYAFAVFAAPPPDVDEVEVSVVDGMNLVTGVKIS